MKQLIAEMAGIVVQILVKPGDAIKEGMEIAILESMKMQIPITANIAGKIAKIHVSDGDFINEGEAILTFE